MRQKWHRPYPDAQRFSSRNRSRDGTEDRNSDRESASSPPNSIFPPPDLNRTHGFDGPSAWDSLFRHNTATSADTIISTTGKNDIMFFYKTINAKQQIINNKSHYRMQENGDNSEVDDGQNRNISAKPSLN